MSDTTTQGKKEPIQFVSSNAMSLADAVEMTYFKTKAKVFVILDSQIEELLAGYNSIHLLFFGICIGAAVSLWIAFKETSAATEKPYYLAVTVAALLGAAYSGGFGVFNYVRAILRKRQIYKNATPIDVNPRQ